MLKDVITKSKLKQINNILYLYDITINEWISVEKRGISYSIRNNNVANERWLHFAEIPSNNNGFLVPRDAIISSISISLKNVSSGSFEIYKYNTTDGLVLLKTSTITTSEKKVETGLNVDISSGNVLKVLFKENFPNKVDNPIVSLELAWKV